MRLLVDAQLPPQLANWLTEEYGVEACTVSDESLQGATDVVIFEHCRATATVIVSKDSDFVDMVCRLGPPPHLLWVTCGNVTNRRLCEVFRGAFPAARDLLLSGEPIVEIGDS